MNVIIYWKSGDYADVYDVDEVQRPNDTDDDLHLFRRYRGEKFEVARFDGSEVRGWQIFLTLSDAKQDGRARPGLDT